MAEKIVTLIDGDWAESVSILSTGALEVSDTLGMRDW